MTMKGSGRRATRRAGLIAALSGLAMWMSLSVGAMREATTIPGSKPSSKVATSAMATFTVTNLNDSGAGSLRQAITDANAMMGADTIDFQAGLTGTITLTSGQLPTITQDLTITGPGAASLTVSGNNASRVFEIAAGVTVMISDMTISNGSVTGFGGGILNLGTVTIQNSTLSGNSASDGGGIFNLDGTMTLTNSTLSGNSANLGGGILNNISGTMTIQNSTLSANSASVNGGGIFNDGTMTIQNSTLSANSASVNGGGIRNNAGTVTIKNSIVANSTSGGDCAGSGTFNTSGVNLSTDATCPGFTQVTSAQLHLGPLQVNSPGSTATHALLCGSVAVDAVTDCTDGAMNPVTTDQRGVARPIDGDGDGMGECDVGAYEAPVNTADSTAPQITCPANVTAVAPPTCPVSSSTLVTFPSPTAMDDCSEVTTMCSPPSGSAFPAGTTTVTCTATDVSGNTASCSFAVIVFNACVQDDSNSGKVALFDIISGAYRICCNGMVVEGTGLVSRQGCTFTIQHNAIDRRVKITVDFAARRGSASLQMPPGAIKCTISDRNITNNGCSCQL
ncbi:MAG: choice-of-anchor Q domain-containing protein [Acidobacteriota bacterium]